jgi:hypothetical protein
MSRKLLLLNIVLACAVVWAGVELRREWQSSKAREAAMLVRKAPPAQVLPLAPLPNPPAVMATSYKGVADKMLFDPSRNPDVPVPPPPAPPPPVPTPPLPVYHGFMNIGDGPMAILSVNAGAPHVGVHPGETIGEFTLVSIDPDNITLQWQDRVIHKSTDELANHLPAPQERASAAPAAEAPPAAPAPPPMPVAAGPQGDASVFGTKTCAPGDSYPEGAVVDGYRKVVRRGAFGPVCFWEQSSR